MSAAVRFDSAATLQPVQRDPAALSAALHAYHARRIQAVSRIVAVMRERNRQV
ncbi:transcriptional regulator [Xanthomonas arboricola pv. juglandis]|uniref:hypothetical protein n=1 Tax=Xanthomonas TaxID=338 RepID=UPI000E9CFEEB|nr:MULTISPECIES: hypothetical protein [Xanthomonas]CAG2084326.1 hypothetical protein XCY_000600 [Xanthomonas euroxanthea]SYZ55839.1 transcriptional regulator [Xanthomonas arboricola pv. juglandis]